LSSSNSCTFPGVSIENPPPSPALLAIAAFSFICFPQPIHEPERISFFTLLCVDFFVVTRSQKVAPFLPFSFLSSFFMQLRVLTPSSAFSPCFSYISSRMNLRNARALFFSCTVYRLLFSPRPVSSNSLLAAPSFLFSPLPLPRRLPSYGVKEDDMLKAKCLVFFALLPLPGKYELFLPFSFPLFLLLI